NSQTVNNFKYLELVVGSVVGLIPEKGGYNGICYMQKKMKINFDTETQFRHPNKNFDFQTKFRIEFLYVKKCIQPRFSCGNHKLNLCIRHAMESHRTICSYIRQLNNSNPSIRRSVQLSQSLRDRKCRLRLENSTRWSSGFLMLESVKRAYHRGAFDQVACPVTLEQIEIYMQVLKPAYLLNVFFQSNHSSIGDTITGVLKLIDTYEKAANILKVSGLKLWLGESWSEGIAALRMISEDFLFEKNNAEMSQIESSTNETTSQSNTTQIQNGQNSSKHKSPNIFPTVEVLNSKNSKLT
ncbi:hypothetical protein BpHYR1_014852, partial [Brachionus plicatilis]